MGNFILLLCLLWPFGGFLLSLLYDSRKYILTSFVVLCCFFGYTLKPEVDSDLSRYVAEFERNTALEYNQWILEVKNGEYSDIYSPILIFFSSRFSSNSNFFIFIACLVMSILMISLYRLVFNKEQGVVKNHKLFFLLNFFLYAPIFYINNFRFFTAFFYFFFALFLVWKNKRFFSYFLLILSPLFHFAYFIPVFFVLLFFLFQNNRKFAILVFIISIVFSFFANRNISFNSLFSGDSNLQIKLNNYSDESLVSDYWDEVSSNRTNWNNNIRLLNFFTESQYYSLLVLFLFISFFSKTIKNHFDNIDKRYLNLSFYLFSIAFFTNSSLESYRFKLIAGYGFLLCTISVMNLIPNEKFKYLKYYIVSLVYPYLLGTFYLHTKRLPFDFFFFNWFLV